MNACSSQRLHLKLNLYKLREERDMEPKTLISLISSMLYEKRYAAPRCGTAQGQGKERRLM